MQQGEGRGSAQDGTRPGSQIMLLDFLLPPNCEASYCEKQVLTMFEKQLDGQMAPEKRDHGNLAVKARFTGDRVSTAIYAGPHDILLTLRFSKEQNLLTLTIEAPHIGPTGSCFKDGSEEQDFRLFESNNDVLKFESRLKEFLMDCRSQSLPIMTRGLPVSPYWTTTDDRLVEAPITRVVYDQQSDHQHIMVLDTTDFGKLLVLDDQANLGESDLVYTTTLMGGGSEDYKDKQVLILGGGDGALLCELLKHQPTKVTMVELDEAVMRAVREHMPSVAGGALDCYKGERSKVIVGDAIRYLEDSRRQGRQFDFIFGDLTDIPINTDHNFESTWDFLRRILSLSFSCLRPGAKYMTHLTGKAVPSAGEDFQRRAEAEAGRLGLSTSVTFSEAFVPSFMEVWLFAQVTVTPNKCENNNGITA